MLQKMLKPSSPGVQSSWPDIYFVADINWLSHENSVCPDINFFYYSLIDMFIQLGQIKECKVKMYTRQSLVHIFPIIIETFIQRKTRLKKQSQKAVQIQQRSCFKRIGLQKIEFTDKTG